MKIVVKLGTSVLTGGSQRLARPIFVEVARQVSTLRQQGHQVILVSSAAIAAGRERLAVASDQSRAFQLVNSRQLRDKQVLAAIGQVHLMSVWQQAFDVYDITTGQMLLTRADLDDRERYLNARDTLDGLLHSAILPVINENDAVATAEIKVGDNDNLSASVATLAGADLLVLLTDQPGLMTANPSVDPTATLIRKVDSIDQQLLQRAGDSTTPLGTGGMATKLQAAQTARCSGSDVAIAGIKASDFLLKVVSGNGQFTSIPKTASKLEGRKRWIVAGPGSSGKLILDAGAVDAVRDSGRSLLAKGVLRIEGDFQRGDVVDLQSEDRSLVARGVARYPSRDLQNICRLHSDQIEQRLGYYLGDAVVHRDEMVIL